MARMRIFRIYARIIVDFVVVIVLLTAFSVLVAKGSLISLPESKCPLSFESAVEYCFVECIKEMCLPVGIQFQLEEEDGSACICMCPPPPEEENPRIEVRRPDFPVGG